jgi:hypothetical protein
MQVQLTSEQIAHCIPLIISYAVILALFIKIRRDIKRIRADAQEKVGAASSGMSNLSLEVQGIRESVRQIEEYPAPVVAFNGLNLTKRAQIVRMYRRGETASSIAAALRTPSNEVQLVLKLHHMLHSGNQV